MATDNDLGDLLCAVLVARREVVFGSDLATTLTIVGSRHRSPLKHHNLASSPPATGARSR